MDRNQAIGITLLFGLAYFFLVYNSPSEAEIAEAKRKRDSIAMIEQRPIEDEVAQINKETAKEVDTSFADTAGIAPMQSEESFVLENDVLKINFSNKGGRITGVELKKFDRIIEDKDHNKRKIPLLIMDHEKNIFEYKLAADNGTIIKTGKKFFEGNQSGDKLTFALRENGVSFIQEYRLSPGSYTLDYTLKNSGGDHDENVELNWNNYLNKLELNESYERYYTSVYYKESDDDPTYCSCRSDDQVDESETKIDWIAHSNQFFSSALIPKTRALGGKFETVMLDEEDESLKLLKSKLYLPSGELEGNGLAMKFYIGPNDFDALRAFDNDLEDIIPFGSSIFGTINRWIIRPLFNFLSSFIGSMGIVILLLTLIVKILLYPLTYKMLHSQVKMAALKPEIEKMREKFKDDSSKQQMESMKLYREYGVNPLGGCMPMILQMPIWFALYRFFPAAIEFRQAPFLWADDLSSFDVITYLPFEIPFFGSHISLFTILWVLTTLLYTYYNSKLVDMSANPAMKYMQYFMPVMFLFFFNNYASGLTAYLMFSNIFNITQTLGTKNLVFNEEKIRAELQKNKEKPKKKKGGFQQRLEKALKEQQRLQQEKEKNKRKK